MGMTRFAPGDTFLFAGIPPDECRDLLSGLSPPVRFEKGEAIYTRRRFRRALGILLAGRADVVLEEDGKRVLMNQIPPGGCFGAAALYGGEEEYVTDVRAATRCEVLFLSQEEVAGLIRNDSRVAENYIRFLSGRIRFLNRRIAGFTGGGSDRRLARYLLEHTGADGTVTLPRSMVALAAALDVGRSSLYRSLDALERDGVIDRSDGRLTVRDLDALRRAAG